MTRKIHWDSHPDASGTIHELKTPNAHHSYDLLIHMWINKDRKHASIENFKVPHFLGPVFLRASFKDGKMTRVDTTNPARLDRLKLKLGGKRALVNHLKFLLEKHPNPEVARVLGLHSESVEDEDYHAGEIDDSKWRPEHGVSGAHVYQDEFHTINTISDGSALHVNGSLLWDEHMHPVNFKLTPRGIEHGANSEEFLFPKRDNSRAKYFRKTLRTALESHPYAHTIAGGIREMGK